MYFDGARVEALEERSDLLCSKTTGERERGEENEGERMRNLTCSKKIREEALL